MLLFKLLTGFTQSRILNDYPEHLLDVVSVFDHTPIAICFEQLMNAMQMVLTTSCSLFSLGNIFKQLLQGVSAEDLEQPQWLPTQSMSQKNGN